MAFISSSFFVQNALRPMQKSLKCSPRHSYSSRRVIIRSEQMGGNGKKQSRSRKFRPGAGQKVPKKKLDPETVFIETGPSRLELIVPTLSLLTVIGIIPFTSAVARALWVRYKITSRRISISSGFQGKDQTEVIYRDVEQIKYVRRLGGAADCVITMKDGAKLEIRAIPDFDKVFEYILEQVDDKAKEASGAA